MSCPHANALRSRSGPKVTNRKLVLAGQVAPGERRPRVWEADMVPAVYPASPNPQNRPFTIISLLSSHWETVASHESQVIGNLVSPGWGARRGGGGRLGGRGRHARPLRSPRGQRMLLRTRSASFRPSLARLQGLLGLMPALSLTICAQSYHGTPVAQSRNFAKLRECGCLKSREAGGVVAPSPGPPWPRGRGSRHRARRPARRRRAVSAGGLTARCGRGRFRPLTWCGSRPPACRGIAGGRFPGRAGGAAAARAGGPIPAAAWRPPK